MESFLFKCRTGDCTAIIGCGCEIEAISFCGECLKQQYLTTCSIQNGHKIIQSDHICHNCVGYTRELTEIFQGALNERIF